VAPAPIVLRGGEVIDGTSAPRRRADVAIAGGHIVEVEPHLTIDGAQQVDVSGLVVAPGFIDPHTHYDAQVLWDRDLTPSSWHGVTTVVMGNCGFGIAPTRPSDRQTILRTLENVEGMPFAALQAGLPWTFTTYPEYLDALDAEPSRLNVASLIGHTPLRFYAMGEAATERAATAEELADMKAMVAEALDAGAVGWSTSRSASHIGAYGHPVPSRAADLDELRQLAGVLGDAGVGTVEATWGPDLFVEEFADLARQIDRPVSWAALMTLKSNPGYAADVVERVESAGGSVYPQIACRPIVVQLALSDPAPLANVPAFSEVLRLPHDQRAALYAQRQWRERAKVEFRAHWGDKLDESTVQESRAHAELINGPTLSQLAAEHHSDPFEVMIELALEENLATRFRVPMTNDDDDQIGVLLNNRRFLLGLSDAGAHTSQLCDANFATYLLSYWVRDRKALSLEDAVWRLTGHPAEVYGLQGRGRIAAGYAADLVAFDPATVGALDIERIDDLPAGADRLVSRSTGVTHVWVNGVRIRADGNDLFGVRPGRLLRNGR
jgi:N-acyl-D-amino-acid deacylase